MMQRLMFGEDEMKPINTEQLSSTVTVETEINMKSFSTQNNKDTQLSAIVLSETVMPDADEPEENLEKSPILSELKSERKVICAKIIGIKKIQQSDRSCPRFMFITELKWNDEKITYISRDHDDFFRYHCWLLDTFKCEAGIIGNQPRVIPRLPGKKWFKNDIALAEERSPLIQAYLNGLTKIDSIGDSYQAQAFFNARPGDPNKQDENLQILLEKATTSHHYDQDGNIRGSHNNMTFIHDDDDKEKQAKQRLKTKSEFVCQKENETIQTSLLDMAVTSI